MQYLKQDITTIDEGIIAHGVNCQRVMGSGVALAIRKKWPRVFYEYERNEPALGIAHFVEITPVLFVANCYTQEFYGSDGRQYASIDAVNSSLNAVCNFADLLRLPVYLPRIGCGLGGLKWPSVREVIHTIEEAYPNVRITICDI